VKKITRAPLMASRDCVNSPDSFCHICGEVVVKKQQRNISDFVKNVYFAYFAVKLGNRTKRGPCIRYDRFVWKIFKCGLKARRNLFVSACPWFGEPQHHGDDCYFCTCNIQGYNLKNKKEIVYPNLPSAMRPLPHGPDIPMPQPPQTLETPKDSASESVDSNDDFHFNMASNRPQLFMQTKLNDLVQDLFTEGIGRIARL
jgi:hypothetical protein